VVVASKIVEVKRLSVEAPYSDSIMDKLENFLEKNDFKVAKIKGSNMVCLWFVAKENFLWM
jgi:maleate cis-trans isomerase